MTNSRAAGLTAELSSTPVTDDTEATGQNIKAYSFHTLPTTSNYYIITGIEWKNGTAVAGDMIAGVDIVNADPPTLDKSLTVAMSPVTLQAGTDAVQRTSVINSALIPKGSVIGVWVNSSSSSNRLRYNIEASEKKNKAVTYAAVTPAMDNTAFATGTTEYYVKVYYKGIH